MGADDDDAVAEPTPVVGAVAGIGLGASKGLPPRPERGRGDAGGVREGVAVVMAGTVAYGRGEADVVPEAVMPSRGDAEQSSKTVQSAQCQSHRLLRRRREGVTPQRVMAGRFVRCTPEG